MKTITHTITATAAGFTQTLKVDDQEFRQVWTQNSTGVMKTTDGESFQSEHEVLQDIFDTVNSTFLGFDLFTFVKNSQDGE